MSAISPLNESSKKVKKKKPKKEPSFHFDVIEEKEAPIPVHVEPMKPKKTQKEQILEDSLQELMDFRKEEEYHKTKARLFYLCFFSILIGVTLTLFGLAITVIFAKFKPNNTMFYCSFIFYVPFFVWFRYIYCPYKREREYREEVKKAQRWRKHLERVRHDHYHGNDEDNENNALVDYTAGAAGLAALGNKINDHSWQQSIRNIYNSTKASYGEESDIEKGSNKGVGGSKSGKKGASNKIVIPTKKSNKIAPIDQPPTTSAVAAPVTEKITPILNNNSKKKSPMKSSDNLGKVKFVV